MIQDFQELPPKKFMMQLLDSTAKAYIFLWNCKDRNYLVDMNWSTLRNYFDERAFKHSLKRLSNEDLLSYDQDREGFTAELVAEEIG